MLHFAPTSNLYRRRRSAYLRLSAPKFLLLTLVLLLPAAVQAQGSPFDTGFNAIQTYAVECSVCKCLKEWRGRRDSNPRPLP
jgi:hypothetical protein